MRGLTKLSHGSRRSNNGFLIIVLFAILCYNILIPNREPAGDAAFRAAIEGFDVPSPSVVSTDDEGHNPFPKDLPDGLDEVLARALAPGHHAITGVESDYDSGCAVADNDVTR